MGTLSHKGFSYIEDGIYEDIDSVLPGGSASRKKLVPGSPAGANFILVHEFTQVPLAGG